MKKKIIATILVVLAISVLGGVGYIQAMIHKPELVDARFRTYKQLYTSIQVGDSKSKVIERIAEHYPENGNRNRPTVMQDSEDFFGLFMNPEKWTEPNCEGIFLPMKNGKVIEKRYSED